jgi:hypothetical protein
MASTTGIELGPDSCLLAAVRHGRDGGAEIFALHRLDGSEWPPDDRLRGDSLRTIRRGDGFPRRASVVVWSTPAETIEEETRAQAIGAIEAAGFHVGSVLTPPEALAQLAAAWHRGASSEAVAWLALNTHGAAIAIVRNGDLLFSRTFPWAYKTGLPTSKAQLLQRYLLIAHLAPELSRGIAAVRDTHGVSVGLVVTCGDLPELRSLTMPLIEELDLEVETLDTTDGLQPARRVRTQQFTELAPALRLATAAALATDTGPRYSIAPVFSRFVAAAAVIAIVGWAGYSYWRGSQGLPFGQEAAPDRSASRASDAAAGPSPPQGSVKSVSPSVPDPAPLPVATRGSREPNRASAAREEVNRRSAQQPQPLSSDTRTATTQRTPASAVPLKEPLPRIDTVLIDQDRRLVIVDGAVVGVGDTIGSRVVVDIARDGIVLREPSGRIVRVRPRTGMTP